MPTDKILITNDAGEQVEATAPVIISASRSTDIPAFYAKWFFNRLAKGYCAWYNPFNQQKMYISFKNCKVIVFWTKNPKPILPYLHILDEMRIHYYFQVTLNDYVNERFEPNVASVEERVETFRQLSQMIGKERVIWRFDPLIITLSISPRELLKRIWNVGNKLKGYTDKLVFSFIDVKAYRKVQNNLVKETTFFTKEDVENAEANHAQRIEIVEGLQKIRFIWEEQGWNVEMATCAEDIDLESYGIEHNRCIDGELMKGIFSDDKELVYYLHTLKWPERDMFGELPPIPQKTKNVKDSGQRKVCGCMVSKDIGMYNTAYKKIAALIKTNGISTSKLSTQTPVTENRFTISGASEGQRKLRPVNATSANFVDDINASNFILSRSYLPKEVRDVLAKKIISFQKDYAPNGYYYGREDSPRTNNNTIKHFINKCTFTKGNNPSWIPSTMENKALLERLKQELYDRYANR